MEHIEKRIRAIAKRLKKSKKDDEVYCQDNIDLLEGLKGDLVYQGTINRDDFGEIPLGGLMGVEREDISRANREMLRQIDKIAGGLGIDLEDEFISDKKLESNPFPNNIHINQFQSNNQVQEITLNNIQVTELLVNLEKELRKPIKDKRKINSLIKKGIEFGAEVAILVLNLINKILF